VKWLTVPEVARRLNRHPVLIRRWIKEGRLRATRFGVREWFITPADFARFKRNQPERRARRKKT